MKKNLFIALFISTHIGFLFLHIHKQMQFIKQSFAKQANEQLLVKIKQKKQAKENELYALQNRQKIKAYAEKSLAFKPVSMTQLHRLPHE